MTFVEALKSKAPEITLHRKENLIEREIAEVVALHLYSQGQITSGTAANIIGISRVEFLQLAGKEKLLLDLDEGEKQTILLATNTDNVTDQSLLLIDERKGEKLHPLKA